MLCWGKCLIWHRTYIRLPSCSHSSRLGTGNRTTLACDPPETPPGLKPGNFHILGKCVNKILVSLAVKCSSMSTTCNKLGIRCEHEPRSQTCSVMTPDFPQGSHFTAEKRRHSFESFYGQHETSTLLFACLFQLTSSCMKGKKVNCS